jgi:hypothetical protein
VKNVCHKKLKIFVGIGALSNEIGINIGRVGLLIAF